MKRERMRSVVSVLPATRRMMNRLMHRLERVPAGRSVHRWPSRVVAVRQRVARQVERQARRRVKADRRSADCETVVTESVVWVEAERVVSVVVIVMTVTESVVMAAVEVAAHRSQWRGRRSEVSGRAGEHAEWKDQ